jgi:hypothetical protein
MAGVKITDLGTLTTAVDADLLYIVDVSDTSQSPQGTSKQIELGNIVSSGTWTPVISNQSGTATIDIIGTSRYSIINGICTDLCRLEIEMDTGQTLEEFNITCAVEPSTNFVSARDITPIWSAQSSILDFDYVTIGAVNGEKYAIIGIETTSAAVQIEIVVQRTYSLA